VTRYIPPVTDHQAAAVQCEVAAGAEVLICEYPTRASAESVAKYIREGIIRAYRPSGAFEAYAYPSQGGMTVWARYSGGAELKTLPLAMTVRVPDYGSQVGYEGVRVLTVEISARCPVCGGPRGELRPDLFVRDGVRRERDTWSNLCGHVDTYAAVLQEAARRRELGENADRPRTAGRPRSVKELRGVDGGRYCTAVEVIAAELSSSPWLSALRAAEILDDRGEHAAADAVRAYRVTCPGTNTSAKSAALYLNHCDRQALAAGATEGDVQ
jgi:hypothetical protein